MRKTIGQIGAVLGVLWVLHSVHAAPPFYDRWETFGISQGLPSDKIFCIRATKNDVWAGTDRGLARFTDGRWKTYTTADGLAHLAVLSIAEDPETKDVWMGTMGGLNRFSAGRFDTFTQFNSGLANNIVYGVTVLPGEVWAATAAGLSRYNIAQHRWTLYDETNTPMHEIWCYSVTGNPKKLYVAVWGGGLLEYDLALNRWKDYRDPDGEMELDLFRDDGLLHDVVAGAACDSANRVWVASYFGLSVYDGRHWRTYMDHDSPLSSNFINFVATHGNVAWMATDNGLCASDRREWWTYRRDPETGTGVVVWTPANGTAERFTTETIFPHNYFLGVSFQGNHIWVATEKGVARGTLGRTRGADND
jgi:ligand-binding sensor domain-containing protein